MRGHHELTAVKQEKILEIVTEFGDVNKTALARMLVAENPLLFDDVEKTRNMIKYMTGNQGNKNRELLIDKSIMKTTNRKNGYGLGEEMHNDVTPHVLPKSASRIGIISDVHIPYQDNKATTEALDWLKDKEIDTLILNGDIIDCYQVSSFTRDPGMRDLQYELDATRAFLNALREQFPKTDIIFLEGNHELRWKRFLMLKAPEIFNMSEFRMDILLKLPELGITWIDNKRTIKAGKLNIIHGHEYYGAHSPVNPAKGIFNKAKANVIFGHFHRTSSHISKDHNQEVSGSWSTGCLCELQPNYAPYNEWNHGFAYVKLEDNGHFRVINKTIIGNEVD